MTFKSGHKMQFDVFLPKQNVVLEYQGEQHYYDVYSLGPLWRYADRDEQKRMACEENGVTLIEIPYWWDFKKESLQATIHQHRPDIISAGTGTPIEMTPPQRKGNCIFNKLFNFKNSHFDCTWFSNGSRMGQSRSNRIVL
jgi:hypothetical protein